jgi:hypothetical protein
MISLPNWSQERLLREAVADFNLRHPDSRLDAKTSDWSVLYRTIHKFIRHRLTDYEERLGGSGYNQALRDHLVREIEKAACRKYRWLRSDHDPRSETPCEVQEPAKPQLMYNLGAAQLADLYTQKNRIIGALREKRRKGVIAELQQQELRQELTKIEAEILRGQILLKPMYDSSYSSPNIYLLGPLEVGKRLYSFGTRKLSPNHLRAEDFACPGCGERIWRSKQPIDLGQRKSAVLWLCGCIFFGLPPAPPGMKLAPLRLEDWIANLEEVSRRNTKEKTCRNF